MGLVANRYETCRVPATMPTRLHAIEQMGREAPEPGVEKKTGNGLMSVPGSLLRLVPVLTRATAPVHR